jgi:hypothetical protein
MPRQLSGQLTLPLAGNRLHPVKAAALARRAVEGWQNDAACTDVKDPETFFPTQTLSWTFHGEALRTCAACSIR